MESPIGYVRPTDSNNTIIDKVKKQNKIHAKTRSLLARAVHGAKGNCGGDPRIQRGELHR